MTVEIQNMMCGGDAAKTLDWVKVNLLRENVEHEYANLSKNIYVISHLDSLVGRYLVSSIYPNLTVSREEKFKIRTTLRTTLISGWDPVRHSNWNTGSY